MSVTSPRFQAEAARVSLDIVPVWARRTVANAARLAVARRFSPDAVLFACVVNFAASPGTEPDEDADHMADVFPQGFNRTVADLAHHGVTDAAQRVPRHTAREIGLVVTRVDYPPVPAMVAAFAQTQVTSNEGTGIKSTRWECIIASLVKPDGHRPPRPKEWKMYALPRTGGARRFHEVRVTSASKVHLHVRDGEGWVRLPLHQLREFGYWHDPSTGTTYYREDAIAADWRHCACEGAPS